MFKGGFIYMHQLIFACLVIVNCADMWISVYGVFFLARRPRAHYELNSNDVPILHATRNCGPCCWLELRHIIVGHMPNPCSKTSNMFLLPRASKSQDFMVFSFSVLVHTRHFYRHWGIDIAVFGGNGITITLVARGRKMDITVVGGSGHQTKLGERWQCKLQQQW